MPTGIDLDHIALAFERAWDGFDRYCGDLGGHFVGGGPDPGFWWHQARFENGMKVELLEPRAVDEHDFLRRFLDRNGPGPHHLTFKVPDITRALDRAADAGYEPMKVNLEHPQWKEAFLHPKASHGIVVQLAQSIGNDLPPTDGLPQPRTHAHASLDRIVHLVADLDGARDLWEGVLDGRAASASNDALGDGVEVEWPGAGRIRLVRPADPAAVAWLGARPGRVHHLAFSTSAPIDGALPDGRGFVVPPERNYGTRLLLRII